MATDGNVKVALRIRPLIGRERIEGENASAIRIPDPHVPQVIMGKDKVFTYDYVFSSDSTQIQVFNDSVVPLVDSFVLGFNSTILAYGQTGSGKTYTVATGGLPSTATVSSSSSSSIDATVGIIPRAIDRIFTYLRQQYETVPDYHGEIKVQFLEIYGEDVRDLLVVNSSSSISSSVDSSDSSGNSNPRGGNSNGNGNGSSLSVRETDQGVTVIGATERKCATAQDMLQLLYEGSLHRQTGATLMNTHSSRSHAIFTIILDQRLPYSTLDDSTGNTTAETETNGTAEGTDDSTKASHPKKKSTHHHHHSSAKSSASAASSIPLPTDAFEHRISKFHLLDLAGSERIKRTQAVGKRMQEGIHINLGLLALGNVISALGDDERKKKGGGLPHIPYRDSKLTFILKDSLGGNSKTLMVACVSPADSNFDESLNTLRYAARARNIKNKPVINRDTNTGIITALRNEIAALKAQLQDHHHHSRSDTGIPLALSSTDKLSLQALLDIVHETDVQQALEKVTELQTMVDETNDLRNQMDSVTEQNLSLRNEIQRLTSDYRLSDDERSKLESKLLSIQQFLTTKQTQLSQYTTHEQQQIQEISTYIFRILKDELQMMETEQLLVRLHELERELAKYKAIVRQEYSTFFSDDASESTGRKRINKINPSLIIGYEALQDNDTNGTDRNDDETEKESLSSSLADESSLNRDPIITAAMKNFGISEEEILEALHINDDSDDDDDDDGTNDGVDDDNGSGDERTGNALSGPPNSLPFSSSSFAATSNPTVHKQHRQRQLMMRGHIQEINDNIDAKERLQSALYAKQTELEQIRRSYEDRFNEERIAKQALEVRIQQLRKQLHQTSTLNQEEKVTMETKLRTSLEEYEQKLRESNNKLRDYDNFLKLRKRTETELYKLQDELSELRKAKIAQIAVMKAERTKYEREHQNQLQKISKLEKEKALIRTELAKVKDEENKKDILLKHKQEDLVLTKRKLRELTGNDIGLTNGSKPPMIRKSVASGRKSILGNGILDPTRQRVVAAVAKSVTAVRKQSRLSLSKGSDTEFGKALDSVSASSMKNDETDDLRKQLETAALRIAEKEQRVEELERRLRARETDVRILEQLIEARDRIRQSMLAMHTSSSTDGTVPPSSVTPSASAKPKIHHLVYDEVDREAGIDQALLDDINAFFATAHLSHPNSTRNTSTGSNQSSATVTYDPSQPESSSPSTDTLMRNNVLQELENRIETAQARIEYQDERILGLADDDEEIVAEVLENVTVHTKNSHTNDNDVVVSSSQRRIPLPQTLDEAQVQIKVLFDMIVNAKTEDRNHYIALENEKEKNRILQDTIAANEAVIKGIRLESDRKIDEVKRQAVNEADLLLRLGEAARTSSINPTGNDTKDEETNNILTDTNHSAQLITMLQAARQKLSTMEEKLNENEKDKERLLREIQYLRKKHHNPHASENHHHGSYAHHHPPHHHHNSGHHTNDSGGKTITVHATGGKPTKVVAAAPPKVPSGPTSASARLSMSSVDTSSLQIFGEKINHTNRPSTGSSASSVASSIVTNGEEETTKDNSITVGGNSTNDTNGNNPGNKKAFDWWKERGIGIVNTNKGRPSTSSGVGTSSGGGSSSINGTAPSSSVVRSLTATSNETNLAGLRSPVSFRNAPSSVIEDMRNGIHGQSIPSLLRPSSSGAIPVPTSALPSFVASNTVANTSMPVSSSLLSNTIISGGAGLLAPSGPLGLTGILNNSNNTAVSSVDTEEGNTNTAIVPPPSSSKKRQQSLSSKYFADHPEINDSNGSKSKDTLTTNGLSVITTTGGTTTATGTSALSTNNIPLIHDSSVRTSGFPNNYSNHRSSIGSDISTATTVSALSQESIEPVRIDTTLQEMKSPIIKRQSGNA